MTVVALSLTADPVNTLTPGFATHIFHSKDTLVGVLVGAFGLGAVLAAFFSGREPADVMRRVVITLAVEGAGMCAFALAPSLAVGLPAMVVGGIGYLASNTTATTAIQLEVEDAQRGRVMALWSVAFLGVRPFGSLLDGEVAQSWGLRQAGVLMALPALLAAAVLAVRRWRPGRSTSHNSLST